MIFIHIFSLYFLLTNYTTNFKANDNRIIIFGGAGSSQTKLPISTSSDLPVLDYYVVLDVNTLEWYHGNANSLERVPYIGHTATLIDDFMFIAFGKYFFFF
jgi:hypothetical protein